MIEPVRKSLAMGDGAMSYLEWETTGPALHFAHANGFNGETYKSLLQPLSGRFHILASDARGHGLSSLPTPPGFTQSWSAFRDDLMRLLDELRTGPLVLAGHSMGGVMSLMVAAARPELVCALVLVEPVFVPANARWLRYLARLLGPGRNQGPNLAVRAAKRRDFFDSTDAIEQSYRGRGAFKLWPDDMLHDYVIGGTVPTEDGRVRLSCAPRVEAESFGSTPIGIYRLASRIRCPVTILHGTNPDTTCRAEEARKFARRKPGTRIVPVPGVGHFLPMERPEIVREEINRIADGPT